MNELFADLERIYTSLLTPAGLIQVATITSGFAMAWYLAGLARSRVPTGLGPGRLKFAAGGFNRVVYPLLALAFIWLAKSVLARWTSVELLKLAVPLIASFAGIRTLVYLIRHLIPPSSLLKASELVIVYGMWSIAALYLTGLLPEVEQTLSGIAFAVGKQKITLLMVLSGLTAIFITLLVAVTLSRIVEQRVMAQETVSLSLRLALTKFLHALAMLVAVLIALPMVGIDLTVLSVFGGAIGVGLGFGLQKVASNYVCGFIILLERSIRVGDLVTVDNKYGTVSSINGRYTVIRSLDGTESLLPNELLITSAVINHTFSDPVIAVKVTLSVAYESDIDQVETLLMDVARQHNRVLAEPAPSVLIKALGDNGIDVQLTVWINDAEQGQAGLRSDILKQIWKRFVEAGIQVPFPQREVRVLAGSGTAKPAG